MLLVLVVVGCEASPRRPLEQATRGIQRQSIDAHGTYLASDALCGRHFATAEADSMVSYLLQRLHESGIPQAEEARDVFGAAPRAFAHAFGATLFRLGARNKLGSLARQEQRSFRLGEDWLPLLHSRNGRVTGRLLSLRDVEQLEHSTLDLRDRIVLIGPDGLRAQRGESLEETLYRLTRSLEVRGAHAVLFSGIESWDRLRSTRYAATLPPDQVDLARSPRGQRLNLHTDRLVLQTQAEAWRLAPTTTIPAIVLAPGTVRSWRSGIEVGLSIDLDQEVSLGQNVLVGFGGGDGRGAGNEVLLLLAHVDHAGVNAAGDVLNGADDNASGVAALLEVAEALAQVQEQLRRSVLLAFVSGELLGMQGTETLLRDFGLLFGDRHIGSALVLDGIGRNGSDRLVIRSSTATVQQRRALDAHNQRSSLLAAALLIEWRPTAVAPARFEPRQHPTSHELLEWGGIPSLLFNDGLDPYLYGQPEDDWKRVDSRKVTRVARLVFRVVTDLARQPAERNLPAARH